jgi:hypothetical protein
LPRIAITTIITTTIALLKRMRYRSPMGRRTLRPQEIYLRSRDRAPMSNVTLFHVV